MANYWDSIYINEKYIHRLASTRKCINMMKYMKQEQENYEQKIEVKGNTYENKYEWEL